MTFIYEQRHNPRARDRFDRKVWAVIAAGAKALEVREFRARHGFPVLSLATFAPQHQRTPPSDDACFAQILGKTVSALGKLIKCALLSQLENKTDINDFPGSHQTNGPSETTM